MYFHLKWTDYFPRNPDLAIDPGRELTHKLEGNNKIWSYIIRFIVIIESLPIWGYLGRNVSQSIFMTL